MSFFRRSYAATRPFEPSRPPSSLRAAAAVALALGILAPTTLLGACSGSQPKPDGPGVPGAGASGAARVDVAVPQLHPDQPTADAGVAGAPLSCEEALRTGAIHKLRLAADDPEALRQVETFLATVAELQVATQTLTKEVGRACSDLDGKLAGGGAHAPLETPLDADTVAKICETVAKRLAQAVAGSAGQVAVEVQPPDCFTDLAALESCTHDCPVLGAAVPTVACEGEVGGHCSGTCSGTCRVDRAQCDGECYGVCQGTCDGQPSSGRCGGRCSGRCSAVCVQPASGRCPGLCLGGCSGATTQPLCTGPAAIDGVEPSCELRCQARLLRQRPCEPARVVVTVPPGTVSSSVVAALEAALPDLVVATFGTARRITEVVGPLAGSGAALVGLAPQLSSETAACVATATQVVAKMTSALSTTAMASTSVIGGIGGP